MMWHGVVGADDNSFLVVVASRQKCPYNKSHFINRDFQSYENRKWKLPRPLQYRMTMSVHSSKRRVKSRTWCGRPPPLSSSWSEMWKFQKNVRGGDVDEVKNWLELQATDQCNRNETQWDQVGDGWIGTGSSKLGEWDVEETVQGFPHSLEEGVEYDKSRKLWLEKMPM